MSPPTTSTTSIDDLPPELISKLFEYLHLKDLVACSMVNKRWHSIFAGFKVHRLAVMGSYYYGTKWWDSNQLIEKTEQCGQLIFGRLVEKPLLSNLRQLALSGIKFKFDPNKLNRFQQLVHLEIGDIVCDQKVKLNLPRLKVLAVYYWNTRHFLSIDCPLLSTLIYSEKEDATLLDVKQPETIRKLYTRMVGAKLVPFKNVECLITANFRAISTTTLQSLPKLREFRYNSTISCTFPDELLKCPADRVKQTLSEFLDEAKELRGSDFQFTFCGFRPTKTMLDQVDFAAYRFMSQEKAYMKSYHLIEPGALHFINEIDYTRLLQHMTGEFPRCFSQKFTGIYEVYATAEVHDVDQFLWFLKSLKFLQRLDLTNTGFNQEFYDQLPASARSLDNLCLRNGHCEKDLQMNFDFIGRLSGLSGLTIGPDLSLESHSSLVRWLGKLKKVDFHVRSRASLD